MKITQSRKIYCIRHYKKNKRSFFSDIKIVRKRKKNTYTKSNLYYGREATNLKYVSRKTCSIRYCTDYRPVSLQEHIVSDPIPISKHIGYMIRYKNITDILI